MLARYIYFELEVKPKSEIKKLLQKAIYDTESGMGSYKATIEEDAL